MQELCCATEVILRPDGVRSAWTLLCGQLASLALRQACQVPGRRRPRSASVCAESHGQPASADVVQYHRRQCCRLAAKACGRHAPSGAGQRGFTLKGNGFRCQCGRSRLARGYSSDHMGLRLSVAPPRHGIVYPGGAFHISERQLGAHANSCESAMHERDQRDRAPASPANSACPRCCRGPQEFGHHPCQ
jgi:hypothetical protein